MIRSSPVPSASADQQPGRPHAPQPSQPRALSHSSEALRSWRCGRYLRVPSNPSSTLPRQTYPREICRRCLQHTQGRILQSLMRTGP